MRKYISYLVFGFLSFFLIHGFAAAGVISPELEEVLNTVAPDDEIPVIVTLADSVDLKALIKGVEGRSRAGIIKALVNKADASQPPLLVAIMNKNVSNIKRFWIFNGLSFQAPADLVRELADFPGLESVRLDATLTAPEPLPAAASIPEWNISAVRAPELWDLGYSGQGIVVANMDTGVDPDHQDIAGKWRGGSNSWFDPHGQYDAPHDSNGHGTRTMGIMVGGDYGGTAIGMAPDAQWIAVKIYDNQDRTTLSVIHQGFQWLIDPDGSPATDDAPDVVNNSWGFDYNAGECITEFEPDIEALRAMDIAVVFSGGNTGPSLYSSVSPANNPGAFAAGAVDEDFTVANFSSSGPSACDGTVYPEVVAPGTNIRTADLTYSGTYPDSYVSVAGTSFSAPHISGAVALLRGSFPDASAAAIETALQDSALDLGETGPDNVYGYGLLDTLAAYEMLASATPLCQDSDGDGYFAGGDSCGPKDCNDDDRSINPGACDIKGDGIDQDCDGTDRSKGKPCPVAADPVDPGDDPTGVEGKGKTCEDGIDNDGDGLTDCDDPDCSRNKSCRN
ncbi:MAG: S8 family serine peptidase [Desulfobulbaceae bacterium]|nr:S8 family serine peptidase [Desulfobulbaceae bacterium]